MNPCSTIPFSVTPTKKNFVNPCSTIQFSVTPTKKKLCEPLLYNGVRTALEQHGGISSITNLTWAGTSNSAKILNYKWRHVGTWWPADSQYTYRQTAGRFSQRLFLGIRNITDEVINWYRCPIITGHFMSFPFRITQHGKTTQCEIRRINTVNIHTYKQLNFLHNIRIITVKQRVCSARRSLLGYQYGLASDPCPSPALLSQMI